MTTRVLQILLGVVCYLCSMPIGMAQETISQKTRADFFDIAVSSETDNYFVSEQETISQNNNLPNSLSDNSTLPIGDALIPQSIPVAPVGDPSSKNESKKQKKQKKNAKRFEGKKVKTRLSNLRASKGIPRNPLTQDALQERTATIRFLHLAAAID